MQQLPEYLIEYLLDRGLDRHSLPFRVLMSSTISHVENAMKRDIERGLYIPPQENINAKYFLRRRQYNPSLSNEINEYLLETKGNPFFYNDEMLLSDEDALPIREKMNEDIKAGRYKPTDLSSDPSHVFDDTINGVYANPLFSDNVNEYIIKGKDKYYNNPIAWRYEPNARALEERVQELIDKGEFIPQGLDSKYLKPLTVRTTNPISNNIQSAQELLNNIDEAIGNNSNITNPNMVDNITRPFLDPEKKFIPVITTPVINEQPSVLKYNSIEEVPDYDPLPRAFDIDDTPYPDMLDRGEITQEQYNAIENSYRARLKEFHNKELAKWNYIASISYGDEPTSDLDETLKEYVSNTEGNNVASSEISSKQILDDINEAIGLVSDNTSTSIPTKSIDDTVINQLIDKHTMTPKKIAMVAIPSVLGAYLLSRDNNKQSNQQYRY